MDAPRRRRPDSKPRAPPTALLKGVPSVWCRPQKRGTSGQTNGGSGAGWWTKLRREDDHCPLAASDDPRRPGPPQQAGALRGAPREAWPDPSGESSSPGQTSSWPVWSAGQEPGTEGISTSSVSSGRLSGSSGGHELCTPPPGVWKEQPPRVLGSLRQPRQSDPRLERLRDKIRAQVAWQASCGSLGTSVPSSASRLCKTPRPAPQKKVRKVARISPAQARPGVLSAVESQTEDKASPSLGCEPSRVSQHQVSVPREKTKKTKVPSCKSEKAPKLPSSRRTPRSQDSEVAGVYAWRRGPALVKLLLGPPPKISGHQSRAPSGELAPTAELGDSKQVPAAECGPDPTQMPKQACSDQQLPASTPSLASQDRPATIQTAMAILRDLRRQIQTGLDMAQHPQSRQGAELRSPTPELQDQTERRQQHPQRNADTQGTFLNRPWAQTQGTGGPPERAWSFPGQRPFSASAKWQTYPHRDWAAKTWDSSSRRPGSPPTRLGSSPQPIWSTSAGQGQEDWGAPVHQPGNPAQRPCRPWSTSFLQQSGTQRKHGVPDLPPWRSPAGSFLEGALGKENQEELTTSQRPRGGPGPPHSSESLREFMRQRAVARRRQAQEEKAAAARAREQRSRRLQEVYRRQREAVLGRPVPVVSQTSPGIVTFVPHCAQPGDLDTSGSVGPPVMQWSKVTSGMVLGDREDQGSFCLCLNKAFSRPKNREMKDSAPQLTSANASLHPRTLRDPPVSSPPPLCIYLDPEEAGSLGMAQPLHFQDRQARLQALEATANVLKQRIDVLTEKLQEPQAVDVLREAALSLPPSLLPGHKPATTTLTAPAWPTALVPSREGEVLLSPPCPPDCGTLPGRSGREWSQRDGPRDQCTGKLQGIPGRGPSALKQRLARALDSFCPQSTFVGSSQGMPVTVDDPCGSLQLEEGLEAGLEARRASSGTLWTTQTCGAQGPGELHPGGLQGSHVTDAWQKSLSLLESLKQLTETRSTQARPEILSELEWPQVWGDQEPQASASGPVQEAGRPNRSPSQLSPARLDTGDNWWKQDGTDQGFELQMLEQSLREEELHEQHQAALLRLRERALEEKALAELAWLEHRRGCLGGRRDKAALSALEEQKQHVLNELQQEQKEIRYLRSRSHAAHRERRLLLRHQRDRAATQRCTARLRQELRAWATRPRSSSPEAQTAQQRSPKTSPEPDKGAQTSSHPPVPRRPSSPPRSTQSPPSTQQAAAAPAQAHWDAGGRLPHPRPAWAEDTAAGDCPDPRDPQVESCSHTSPGDAQTEARPLLAEEKAWTPTDSGTQGQSQRSPGGDGPLGPWETRVPEELSSREGPELGLDVARSLSGELLERGRWRAEAQRTETCLLEDSDIPSAQLEATQLAPSAGAGGPQEKAPREGGSLPQLPACVDGGSDSAPGTSWAFSLASSSSSLSCPSLQEFQKVSAVRVDLSDSSASLPELGLPAGPSWAGELSVQASGESPGCLSLEPQAWPTWGLLPGEPWLGGASGGWGLEGGKGGSWRSTSSKAAEVGSPEREQSWPRFLPDASRPRSGSELSETSSQIWGEDSEEDFQGPGSGIQPVLDLSEPDHDVAACTALASLGTHEGQEPSKVSLSLASRSDQGDTERKPLKAACVVSSPQTPPTSDLELSLSISLGTSTSEGTDFSREEETRPLLALAGSPERPSNAKLVPSSPARGPESCAPGCGPAPTAPGETHPHCAPGSLTETLSPVDTVLSFCSPGLVSSAHRDTSLPSSPEQSLLAKAGEEDVSTHSGDFLSPLEEALCLQVASGPPGEDTSMATDELSSWHETVLEDLSPESQELGSLAGAGLGSSLEEEPEKQRHTAENEAPGDQWSLSRWAADAPGGFSQLPTQPPPPQWTREDLPRPLVSGDQGHARHSSSGPTQGHKDLTEGAGASGSQSTAWGGGLCSESAEGWGRPASPFVGVVELLDTSLAKASTVGYDLKELLGGSRGAALPPYTSTAALAAPPTGSVPSMAGGCAEPHGQAGEEAEGALGCCREDPSRQPLLRGHTDREAVVEVVSTQLTRRILLDSLAALSGLARQGSWQTEGGPRGAGGSPPGSPQLAGQLVGALRGARDL